MRSDWETSTNGDDEDRTPIKRTNSIGYLTEDDVKRKAAIDQHVAHYINDQLERMKSNESADLDGGELETSLDGTVEKATNGHRDGGNYFDKDPYFSK